MLRQARTKTKMKITSLKFFIPVFALLIISSEARGQFINYKWQMTLSNKTELGYFNGFTAISCSGNNCTAFGVYDDTAIFLTPPVYNLYYMFWRSNDGGITWTRQNPRMPNLGEAQGHGLPSIQQIDSLNVVATTDSNYLLRTFDGGATWERQTCGTTLGLYEVHFSDPMTGIVVSRGTIPIHTTTDGGKHWTDAPYREYIPDNQGMWFVNCHSYGNGKFRAFRKTYGQVYTTINNWKTIDSTNWLIDSTTNPQYTWYNYTHCIFSTVGESDLMMAYGSYLFNGHFLEPAQIRSINGGKTWTTSLVDSFNSNVSVLTMSSLDRDTMIAGVDEPNNFYLSTNRGITWQLKPFSVPNYQSTANQITSITWASGGYPVAIYGGNPYDFPVIIRGSLMKSHVEQYEQILFNTFIYPNPASEDVNIITPESNNPIHLYDMLGREMLKGTTSDEGKLRLDVSKTPKGVYSVMLEHAGRMISLGKVSIMR